MRLSPVAKEGAGDTVFDFTANGLTTMDGWYQDMIHVPPSRLLLLIRMGRRVLNFLPKGRGE